MIDKDQTSTNWEANRLTKAVLSSLPTHPASVGGDPNATSSEDLWQAVDDLATALQERDANSWIHSARVRTLATAIGLELELVPDEIADIILGGALHDIGKIGVPVKLLQHERRLTDEEYLEVMEHTRIGERLLEPILSHRPSVLQAVRSHHERVDGHGLPDGLKGDLIPLSARIVAVADAFDAMTHARPYRKGVLSPEAALHELDKWTGSQFDGRCVQAFADWFGANSADRSIAAPEGSGDIALAS